MTVLYIKNMVCDRCKAAVSQALTGLGFTVNVTELGVAEIKEHPDNGQLAEIRSKLNLLGFELLEDRQQQTVDRIKSAIIELVHYHDNKATNNLSSYLSDKLNAGYSSLSKLFSENTGTTIERFFILQKVERVKELLFYNELSLNEIATKMNYSSTAYLSSQFKSVTGMTPSQFKAMRKKELKQLDKI